MSKVLDTLETLDENIDSTVTAIIQLIKERFLIPAILTVVAFAVITIMASISGAPEMIIIPIIIVFVVLYVAYGYVRNKAQQAFMQAFADENGYDYRSMGAVEEDVPHLQIGHNSYAKDVIRWSYKGMPIRILEYNATKGYGRNAKHVSFTICKIHYIKKLPNIFLDNTRHIFPTNIADFFIKYPEEQILKLEGDFNKYFTLYIPNEYQIKALQIFTPDIMATLIDKSKDFSMELYDKRFYVYAKETIETRDSLDSLIETTKFLFDKITPVLERLNRG
jgi:hypothetical protein